jgi:hypothetical protein
VGQFGGLEGSDAVDLALLTWGLDIAIYIIIYIYVYIHIKQTNVYMCMCIYIYILIEALNLTKRCQTSETLHGFALKVW